MKALHIMDGPPLYTNCFLLVDDAGSGCAAAIDPAAPAARFAQALQENGATLTHILLTHGHHDHVGSVQALRETFGARVYVHAADAAQFGIDADETYTDFGKIAVGGMTFETIFTPGHTPGSVCILCEDLLFSGDTLFAEDIGRTDLPGGDAAEMKRSLEKLAKYVRENVQVLPGHEEFSTMDHERAHNPALRF